MARNQTRDRGRCLGFVPEVLLFILLSPLILVWALFYVLWGLILYVAMWLVWGLRGRFVLFVYSDSPIWREYIESEILPRLRDRALNLYYSARKS